MMKNWWERLTRLRGDRGEAMISVLSGMAIGIVLLGILGGLFVQLDRNAQSDKGREVAQSTINEALNRVKQTVQVSAPIVIADRNILITEGTQGDGTPTRTRWIVTGGALYQQTWTGYAADYPFAATNAWRDPVSTEGKAPAAPPTGGGVQSTAMAVDNIKPGTEGVFSYFGDESAQLPATPAMTSKDGTSAQIKRVVTTLNVAVGKGGVMNSGSAATLNMGGGETSGTLPAAQCPKTTLVSGPLPKLSWTPVSGVTKYGIYRNSTLITHVTLSAGATKGTWEDTAATPVAGEAITYTVTAVGGAGTESVGCRPIIYRPAVDAPALTSTLMPRGTNGLAWSTGPDAGLTKPQIRLDWAAVENATGYEVFYRELDPASGVPVNEAYTNLKLLDADTTTFTWTDSKWASRYEFYIRASSRVGGSPESRHSDILTHPKAPQGLTVEAQYGADDAADRLTKGRNVIKWNSVPTASKYEVWRYNSGKTGAATLACTTTALTCTDKVDYGTEYTYYVTASNKGPRGYNASGTQPVTEAASSVPEGTAESKAAKVTELQYPPIPKMKPLGTGVDNTKDIDGSNIVLWDPAASATGYYVYRVGAVVKTTTCLTGTCPPAGGGGITATKYTDIAAPGSRFGYAIRAYNTTGLSIEVTPRIDVTQRPAAPAVSVLSRPTLTDNSADFRITANGDSGNDKQNRFCTADGCTYELRRNNVVAKTTQHPGTDMPINWDNAGNDPGVTTTYTARSRNGALTNGGWSDPATAKVDTYPGTFSVTPFIGDRNGQNTNRFRLYLTNADWAGSDYSTEKNGFVGARWSGSAGAANIAITRHGVAHNTLSSNGSGDGLPTESTPGATSPHGNANAWEHLAAPGATYKFTVTAIGQNGLRRSVQTGNVITAADPPQHGTAIVTCSGNTYSNQQTALQDHPGHRVGGRLIDFQWWPKYGNYRSTWIRGIESSKYGGLYHANDVWVDWNVGTWAEHASGPGVPYFYGLTTGFDVLTWGGDVPNSARVRITQETFATFNSGCAPAGTTWGGLTEPTYACYGYIPGRPCSANNPQNRPQWHSR